MENKNNVKCSFIVTILAMITVVFSIAANTVSARLSSPWILWSLGGTYGSFLLPIHLHYFRYLI